MTIYKYIYIYIYAYVYTTSVYTCIMLSLASGVCMYIHRCSDATTDA